MRGTPALVNRAIHRPILIGGVEKSLFLANVFLLYLLLASIRFHLLPGMLCVVFFMCLHALLRVVSKQDPHVAVLFKRATRYWKKSYFPALSHPLQSDAWPVHSVSELR